MSGSEVSGSGERERGERERGEREPKAAEHPPGETGREWAMVMMMGHVGP